MSDFSFEFSSNAQLFFSPDSASQVKAGEYYLLLLSSLTSPDPLISILSGSFPDDLFFISSMLLNELLTKKWSIFSTEQKATIYSLSLARLAQNWKTLTEKKFIDTIIRLICRISRQSWNESIEFSRLPSYCTEFLSQSEEIVQIGLRIIRELVLDMAPNSENQMIQHQRNSKQFKQWTIPGFFSMVANCLQTQCALVTVEERREENIEIAIETLANILEFCKDSEEDSEVELPMPMSPHWDFLKSPIFVDSIEEILKNYSKNSKIAKKSLRILANYVSIKEQYFCYKALGTQKALKFCVELMGIKDSISCEEILYEFIWLLNKISLNKCALGCESPELLLERTFELTKSVMTMNNENLVVNIMGFWEYLTEYTHQSDEIRRILTEICKLYIEYLVKNDEITSSDQIFQSNLSILSSLSKSDFESLTAWILEIFKTLISHPPYSPSLPRIIYILSAFIADSKSQYTSSILQKSLKSASHSLSASIYSLCGEIIYHFFMFFKHLIETSCTTLSLIASCLHFLKLFIRIYINSSSLVIESCYLVLMNKLGIASENEILSIVLSFIFAISGGKNCEVYKECMEIFADLAAFTRLLKPNQDLDACFFCGPLKMTEESIVEVLRQWCNGGFSLMGRTCDKARSIFVRSVFKLYFISQFKTNIDFSSMLGPLETIISEFSSQNTLESAISICYNLLGILESISNADHYTLFFNWLCDKSNILLSLTNVFSQSPKTYVLYFKFLKELSFNRTERLSYLDNRSIGTSLFRLCQKVLNSYFLNFNINQVCSNKYDDIYKPLAKSTAVFTNLLSSRCANIHSLLSDPSVMSTFKIILRAVLSVPTEEVTFCIKIFKEIYDLFMFISGNSRLLKEIVYMLEESQVVKLFDLLIEGCQSSEQYVCQLSYCTVKEIVNDLIFKTNDTGRVFFVRHSEQLKQLMRVFLSLVFGGEAQNITLISYPLLGLINLLKNEYSEMIPSVCMLQGPERSNLIHNSIEVLWSNLEFSWAPDGLMRNMKIHRDFEKRLNKISKDLKVSA